MTLTRFRFLLSVAAAVAIANVLAYITILPFFNDILLLLLFTALPGVLAFLAISPKTVHFKLESLLNIVGLGVAGLILSGLLVNSVGPALGISRPLSRLPMLVTIDLLLVALTAIIAYRHKVISVILSPKLKPRIFDVLLILYGLVCLLLVLGGTQVLNNGGSGLLIFVALVALAIYILITVLLRKKLSRASLPIAIFLLSFSLLLAQSLRSHYVFGFDINQEFYVFHLSNAAQHWSIASYRNPYNACLSITILPTVLHSLTHIAGNVLFKVVFQGLFAFVPVAIYALVQRVFGHKKDSALAFLSAAVFASQTWFILQAPVLVRQEVALVFFALTLLALFSKTKAGKTLGLFFALMVILSHYSTAYVMLAYFALYALVKLLFFAKQPKLFSGKLLIVFFLVTFFWQYQVTNTSHNINSTVKQTITSLPQVFSSNGIGSSVSQLTFSNPNLNTNQNVINNNKTQTENYRAQYGNLYAPQSYQNYSPEAVPTITTNSRLPGGLASVLLKLGTIVKLLISDLLPLIGLVILGLFAFRKRHDASIQDYIVMAFASMFFIAVMLALPLLKVNYNLTRLYLQSLVVFSPLIIYGGSKLLSRLPKLKYPVITALVMVFLLYSAGGIFYLAGGNLPGILSNQSSDYDMYYTTKGEVASAKWLGSLNTQSPIYADSLASLKLAAYGETPQTNNYVAPSTITTNAYVYASNSNLRGKDYYKYEDGLLVFNFPSNFLNANENAIYATNTSRIYH